MRNTAAFVAVVLGVVLALLAAVDGYGYGQGGSTAQRCPNPPNGIVCPANYDPVCATTSDGRFQTFSNACQVTISNCENRWRIVKEGQC